MKAFIFDETSNGAVAEIVKRFGIEILSPQSSSVAKNFENLGSIDFFVLEITAANPEVNFLLAQAILQQKPTLCLYQKNKEPRDLLNYLIQRGTPKCISTHAYFTTSLSNTIGRFFSATTELLSDADEVPSIKFTLRLTPKVDRYLEWKSKKVGRTKADLMRDWLRIKIDEDAEFWKKRRK